MEVKGKLINKLQSEAGTSKAGKAWVKQSIVIDTETDFYNIIAIQFFGEDKIKQLETLKVGDIISVDCNVYSREYKGRYFHNINGWKIAKESKSNDEGFVTPDDMPF
tara:strand:- start:590 stop:910 length:321 start_codon:yes stop_codon:yes gene_type:complete